MSHNVPRFLNLPANSDPFALLGLAPQQCTPAKVDEALRMRIARTYSHPDGRSDDAEEIRQLLRDAAAKLKDPVQRARLAAGYRPPHVRPMLTPFDREALAILVGSGGWNAISRARLVSLAQHHGVAPAGLMKVISGLSRHAREGRARLATADITAGRLRFQMQSGPSSLDRIGAISDSVVAKYVPELREQSAQAAIKLSIVFGLLAIVMAVFFVWILLPQSQPAIPRTVVDSGLVPAEVRSAERQRNDVEGDPVARVVSFDRMPTFSLDLPGEIARRAEKCAAVPTELTEVANRLTITAQPSEAIYQRWNAAIADVSIGWLLLDDDRLELLSANIIDALHTAAGSPAVSERLLRTLQPIEPSRAISHEDDPIALISSPWRVKQLARILQRTNLPPILGDQARTVFSAGGGDSLAASIDRDPPEYCAAAWLDHLVPEMIEKLAHVDDALLYWEMWLAAQRKLDQRADFDRSILLAIHHMLTSTISLQPNEPGLMVLGRLVTEVDLSRSALARQDVPSLISDARIDVNRLATFSAILAANPDAPWIDESLLLPLEADEVMRRRVQQDMVRAWPQIEVDDDRRRSRQLSIEPEAAKRWLAVHQALMREQIARRPLEQMRQLTAAAQVSHAIALLAAKDDELSRRGRRLLDELEAQASHGDGFRSAAKRPMPTNTNPRGRGPLREGTGVRGASMQDGIWAAAYESAGRNHTERMKQLDVLRERSGDLGPSDAAMFVREVYRATPMDVREEAQMILTASFPRGITVAMYMLDLLPEAPRTDMNGDLITRYTASPLPSVRSERWRRKARLALLYHAANLRGSGPPEIDLLASLLHDAALGEAGTIDPALRTVQDAQTTTEAAHKRYLAWQDLARSQLPSSIPVPGDLATLDRRHQNRLRMAESPIQAYVALAVSTLELIAYVTSTDQPALSDVLHELLRHAADQRIEAEELLVQAILVERTIGSVWRLRIDAEQGATRSASIGNVTSNPASTVERNGLIDIEAPANRSVRASSRVAIGMTGAMVTPRTARSRNPQQDNRWNAKLGALDPRSPQDYFLLAEDIADTATTDRERGLAKHLFALAGVLAPERYGQSACLALAQLEEHRPTARRLRALANLLDPYAAVSSSREPAEIGNETRNLAAAIDLGEAFSALRLGRGSRAMTVLRRHGVEELLQRFAFSDAVDPHRLSEDARASRRPRDLDSPRIDDALLIEIALLAGAERPWSADLKLYDRQPLIEVDDDLLRRMLGANADRPFYRDGRWVGRP
jgi:hypothetical protein